MNEADRDILARAGRPMSGNGREADRDAGPTRGMGGEVVRGAGV